MSIPPRPPQGQATTKPPDPIYLLTYHGSLVCSNPDGALSQRPVADPGATPVALPAVPPARSFERFLAGDEDPSVVALRSGPLAGLTATYTARTRTLTLHDGAHFLTAERDSPLVTRSRTQALAWEGFMPLAQRDLAVLRGCVANRWLLRSSGAIVPPGEAGFGPSYGLRLGDRSFDLRYQTPFQGHGLPYRLRLLREGWRVDEACLLRPLVVMTAFRTPALHEQLLLSMRSLREVAGFDGQVLLLTDMARDVLQARFAGSLGRSTAVITLAAADAVASAAARYALLDWADARKFQPILCVDPDVMFDADLLPLLAAVAASDHLAAPVERQSLLRAAPEVGASLLQQDGPLPRLAAGFSTAVLGIPNLPLHRDTLLQIRRVMINRSDRFGRLEPEWLEQEVTNYVCHKLGAVDTHVLSRFFRVVPAALAPATDGAMGLLRFDAPRGSEAQTDAMRAALRARANTAEVATPAEARVLEDDIEGPEV